MLAQDAANSSVPPTCRYAHPGAPLMHRCIHPAASRLYLSAPAWPIGLRCRPGHKSTASQSTVMMADVLCCSCIREAAPAPPAVRVLPVQQQRRGGGNDCSGVGRPAVLRRADRTRLIPAPPMNHHRRLHSRGLFAAASCSIHPPCMYPHVPTYRQSRLESAWCSQRLQTLLGLVQRTTTGRLPRTRRRALLWLHSDDDHLCSCLTPRVAAATSQSAALQRVCLCSDPSIVSR